MRPIHFVQSVLSKLWTIKHDDELIVFGLSVVQIEVGVGVYECALADITHHQGKTVISFSREVRGSARFFLVSRDDIEIVYEDEVIS